MPAVARIHSGHAEIRDLGGLLVPRVERVGRGDRSRVRAGRLRARRRPSRTPTSCSTCSTRDEPEGVPPPVARHVLRLVLRARRDAGGRAQDELPDARAHARERRRAARARARACGSRRWSAARTRSPTTRREVFERLAPLAKSKLVIDNEFVADLEPELWDGDEVTADIGAAGKRMQELDLLPAPVPGPRVPRRARPPPRDAALPGRRPLLREPLGAQGRDAVLDERERRRQVAARGRGPRHPARHGLRRAEREDASSACRPASSRAASRSTRSSTG